MPKRIQLKRTPGWRLKDESTNYVIVTRLGKTGKFGNPFTLDWVRLSHPDATDHDARIVAVQTFHRWLTDDDYAALFDRTTLKPKRPWILKHLPELLGRDLCCWCPLPARGEPDWCHANVYFELLAARTGGTP